MSSENLYAEQTCPRCGKTFLKAASFCPHCGYVKSESWWERLTSGFRSGSDSPSQPVTSSRVFSTVVGLAVAGFFLYQALQTGSIQSWIISLFSFAMAARAWFTTQKQYDDTRVERTTTLEDVEAQEDSAADPQDQFFYCENCKALVPPDATTCPKCGMDFGVN
ncbi:MAG: hypothetical protein L0Y80_12740 [Ignavibacteriae bacterium]|nr:hypothetical protein [Ignavibacteriota bacterium]